MSSVKAWSYVCIGSAALLFACGGSDDPSNQGGSAGAPMSRGGASPSAGAPSIAGSTAMGGTSSNGAAGAGSPGSGGSASLAGSSAGGAAGAAVAGSGGSGGAASGAGGVTSGSGGSAGSAGTAGAAGAGGTTGPSLPPVTDYTKAGPFATMVDTKVGPNSAYTVYRPAKLGDNGFVHAPIIFGPGIGQQVTVHATMLTNFASHGFVVVGTPVLNGGPGDAGNLKSMKDGLDWILQQNAAQNSVYLGKLDVKRAISMGYSVGGTSAVQLGGHEAVATTVSIHGHTAMAALHGPLLQTTGTKDTVGLPLQQQTYSMSQAQTFLATLTGADHGYIQNQGGGNERPAILAWLRYWIYNDAGAKHYFYGTDCVLCMPPWENPQRKNWQ